MQVGGVSADCGGCEDVQDERAGREEEAVAERDVPADPEDHGEREPGDGSYEKTQAQPQLNGVRGACCARPLPILLSSASYSRWKAE